MKMKTGNVEDLRDKRNVNTGKIDNTLEDSRINQASARERTTRNNQLTAVES